MKMKASDFFFPAVVLSVFLAGSAIMWFTTRRVFFLFDLPFLGFSVAGGILVSNLWDDRHLGLGRRITQFLVGAYFLFFLNLVMLVNMQIEGLFFQLLSGFFTGALVHFAVAKLLGPLVFGRGFCAYGCWTAMVLDFLPWKQSPGRIRRAGLGRYLHLGLSFALVAGLFFGARYNVKTGELASIAWFVVGTVAYWAVGIILAAALRDNRAFCKYLCPVAPLQKVLSRFSLMAPEIDTAKCIGCHLCEKHCPMDVALLAYAGRGQRVQSTECINCGACGSVCPAKAVKTGFRPAAGFREELRFRAQKAPGSPLRDQSSMPSQSAGTPVASQCRVRRR